MIYLDSCLLIYLVESRSRAGLVRAEMDAAGGTLFAISPLVVLECLVGPLGSGDEVLRSRYERLLGDITLLTMGVSVYERAARLRAAHRLATPDALHLAAALEHGCDELWSSDEKLLRAAGSMARRVGVLPGA